MGKQRNKRFNKHQNRPYGKNNNDNRKPYNNKRKPHAEGFVKKEKQPWFVKVSLKEDQVGITEYITSGDGFQGVVKSRFSDFHVNEIDLTGKVLQLDDLTIPQEREEVLSTEELEKARELLKDVISDQEWVDIQKFAETKMSANVSKSDESIIYVEVTTFDKDERTLVHKIIKKLYESKLVSSTVEGEQLGKGEGTKFIKIMKPKGRDRNRWTFPEEYVHFLMHKENLDTSEVATMMAQKINLRPSQVNYCGTKDKRAKTTQKFCIKKRTPAQIVSSVRHVPGVKVGNFEFHKEVLKLGQLKGNRFRLALRHLTGDKEHIETSLQNIKEHGFINYFGLQRFGNCSSVPTYEIGVALLCADYKLACELILKPRQNDLPFLTVIREKWWKERNSKEAAAMFHTDRFIEKKLLDGLAQYGEHDYSAALRKIPRNMLLLYPHAFQSFIFNNIASRRIKEFGLKLIPGDLVYRNKEDVDDALEIEEVPQEDEDEEEQGEETPNDAGEKKSLASEENDSALQTAATDISDSIYKRKVKALTEEDINSKNYSIFDVVLPLPGHDITYPGNVVASWYEEMLAKYNLSSEKLKHNVKTFAMAGAYRKLLLKPTEMSWEIRSYATPEQTLILSDWELLQGKTLEQAKSEEENKYEALILNFCLPTAAYATMMLRELLKADTSAACQKSLQETAMKESNPNAEEKVCIKKDGEEEEKEDNVETNGDAIKKDIVSIEDKEVNEKSQKSAVKRNAAEMNETETDVTETDVTAAKLVKDEEEQ